jgi:hypothetical protein
VWPAGNFPDLEGGFGFGIEADLSEIQDVVDGLREFRRRRGRDNTVEREAFEAGQAIEVGQLGDTNDDRASTSSRCSLRPRIPH